MIANPKCVAAVDGLMKKSGYVYCIPWNGANAWYHCNALVRCRKPYSLSKCMKIRLRYKPKEVCLQLLHTTSERLQVRETGFGININRPTGTLSDVAEVG